MIAIHTNKGKKTTKNLLLLELLCIYACVEWFAFCQHYLSCRHLFSAMQNAKQSDNVLPWNIAGRNEKKHIKKHE